MRPAFNPKRFDRRVTGFGSRWWRTIEGVELQWSEMTVSHLRNAAASLRKRAAEQVSDIWTAFCCLQGEQAEYALDDQLRMWEEVTPKINAYADEMDEYANYRDQHVQHLKRVFG